jgi:hypothetical protein
MENLLATLTQGVDLSQKIKLPVVEVETTQKTNNVLIITASILAVGLIAAAVIAKRK